MKKLVLLGAMLAVTLLAVAPAFGQSLVIPFDDDGFVGVFEGEGPDGEAVVSGDTVADNFEFGAGSTATAGSGFELDSPFAGTAEFGNQDFSAVGADGFVYLVTDAGIEIIDLSELEGSEDSGGEGGASEEQYDG